MIEKSCNFLKQWSLVRALTDVKGLRKFIISVN